MYSASSPPALSEEYSDLIVRRFSSLSDLVSSRSLPSQPVDDQFSILYAPLSDNLATVDEIGYFAVPKLFTGLNVVSLEASGILPVRIRTYLQLSGAGVLVGFLDSGIDYTHPAFRNEDGSSRILRLWDQSDTRGTPPAGISYGTEYTKEQLDEILLSGNSDRPVPERDPTGHGTAVAGIACGSPDAGEGFTGAAPESSIAFVRLKPAKQYLRDYFRIPDSAAAWQENDLMTGIRYLLDCAELLSMPLVICISSGTSQGSHTGNSPLEEVLDTALCLPGIYAVTGTGNESGMEHHFRGQLQQANDHSDIELLIDQETTGFTLELWADAQDLYSIGFTSPRGEIIRPIPPGYGTSREFSFLLEQSKLALTWSVPDSVNDSQLILIRFTDPAPGIWHIRVAGLGIISGIFHLWLPVTGLVDPHIRFLAANADTTLVIPSCSSSVISVSTWNAYTDSLYVHSGRGYTRDGQIRPDFSSPGVQVTCPVPGGMYSPITGSSAASALGAGAAALLLDAGMRQEPPRLFPSSELKELFIQSAKQRRDYSYPNKEWGYGTMNVYEIFLSHFSGRNI